MKRNLYLNIQNKSEALKLFLNALSFIAPKSEIIDVTKALHRITSDAVFAVNSSPSYNSCAMDGIAVISSHTMGAAPDCPVLLKEGADYLDADTGDMISPPYDAVIMAEELIETETGYKIIAPTHPFAHVRAIGEDIVSHEMLLPSRHEIKPIDIAVLLSAGVQKISVIKKPSIGLIPTGDEMIDYTMPLADGKIIETNSYMFENLIREFYGTARRYPIIPDIQSRIEAALLQAARENDIVIINAGSSAGRDDYTVHALRALGDVYVHGVAIKPGKPVILGKIDKTPVIGLPGYPVSSYIAFMEFVLPVIQLYTGCDYPNLKTVTAKLSKAVISGLKYEEYIRVRLGIVNDNLIAAPLSGGAGASMSLVRCDGFCIIPQNSEGVSAHEDVSVKLMKPLSDIEKTIVCTGSHDLILDIINDLMLKNRLSASVSSTHVGSMAGLIALSKKEAHIAPSHLLDENDGTYNLHVVQSLFKNENMVIIKGVKRRQGFIVPKGNPMNIQNIHDLPHVRYINRQRGAGTRVLLDFCLKQAGIPPEKINGYRHEAATHMSVAAAVQKGNADTGMGVYSAAKALNLDFIDIACEEYDFVTYESFLELPKIQKFIEILKSKAFADKLDALGGYTYEHIGEIIHIHSV